MINEYSEATMAETMYQDALKDIQTSILGGVTAAALGVVSEKAADSVIKMIGLDEDKKDTTLNAVLELVLRSVVSSVLFVGASRVMPETSANVYFGYVYFLSDTQLTQAAIKVGTDFDYFISSLL